MSKAADTTVARPLVTAIIDTFNHEAFIERALTSVLTQGLSERELEILVVDDGSTDRTPEILQQFSNRVRVVRKQNGGQASAFNIAIPLARGEIVAFLDGDDWWSERKLIRVIEAFQRDLTTGVVGHGFYEIDEVSGRSLAIVPDSQRQVSLRTPTDGINFRSLMSFFGTSRVAIRKRVLDLVGPIPPALVIEADEYMSTVAVARSNAVLIPEALTFYRLHTGNSYQFQDGDVRKIRIKSMVLNELSGALRRELPCNQLEDSVVTAVVKPIEVEATRLKLMCGGGMSWDAFKVERASIRLAYKHMPWKYRLFKGFVLALALILPPRLFYKLQQYYGKMNLRRFRRFTGEPVSREFLKAAEGNTYAKQ